jgi:hypothetical protein
MGICETRGEKILPQSLQRFFAKFAKLLADERRQSPQSNILRLKIREIRGEKILPQSSQRFFAKFAKLLANERRQSSQSDT